MVRNGAGPAAKSTARTGRFVRSSGRSCRRSLPKLGSGIRSTGSSLPGWNRKKIAPAPEADRRTLIRRLSLDLLGLPPTPRKSRPSSTTQRPDAYEQLVDRLLASPHFGERWGRHWLDLARYADSDGYEKDSPRPFAWRYRNWVIDAINRDLPFDQFTIEQLAGDLLPDATLEQKVATGFHRNTLTNKEGGVDQEEFRVAAVIDRVNTTEHGLAGADAGLCTVPFAQVRPARHARVLRHVRLLQSGAGGRSPGSASRRGRGVCHSETGV